VPIEEAEQEVEKLNEDRLEKFSRLKVVERERAALEVSFLYLQILGSPRSVS
jgi:hypothetical protein